MWTGTIELSSSYRLDYPRHSQTVQWTGQLSGISVDSHYIDPYGNTVYQLSPTTYSSNTATRYSVGNPPAAFRIERR